MGLQSMLKPHVITVRQVLIPCYSLINTLCSLRVSFVTPCSIKLVKVFSFLLDAWHEPLVHQSYPPVLGYHGAKHSASTAGVVAYLAYA